MTILNMVTKGSWWGWEANFATQWPSPNGYHVPLSSEWSALWSILRSTFKLSGNRSTLMTYLKMPPAGNRYEDASTASQGTNGLYWSSSAPSDGNYANMLYFTSDSVYATTTDSRSDGMSIRCFKNSPVAPDSSWTRLYNWSSVAAGAWVFRNSSLWLISVSWDGVNWTTIQDKNLWATTVYNSWNTCTIANCGCYFQWGNNYPFPRSWSVNKTSTKVNASAYWPWNYYFSSVYVSPSEWYWKWETSNNRNLRWWIDGNVPV